MKNSLKYKRKSSFAHVLCTANSSAGQVGTSLEEMFGSDANDATFSSNVSDDVTYDAAAGTFTFARAGIYHIVLVANTQQETAHRLHSFAMNLNSAAAFYASVKQVNTGYDPVESTHQTIVSLSADDVLHIKMLTAGNTATIAKGTSVTITEITSGHYASQQATATGANTNIDEFNPFDTDYTNNPASYTTVTAGMTVTGTAGSFTANSAGRYLIMVSNVFVMADQSGGTSQITMKLKKGGTAFATRVVTAIAADDAAENTFCTIENLAAADVLIMTWDTSDTTAGDGVQAVKGTTFTVYKLEEGHHKNGTTSGFFGRPHISVQNTETDFTGTSAEINPFDSDSYDSANSFDTRVANGITFTPADGKFTVSEPGLYAVYFSPVLEINAGNSVDIEIKVNGTIQVSSVGKVANGPDPLDKTVAAFLELNKGDYITVTIEALASGVLEFNTGSQITIFRYFGLFNKVRAKAKGQTKRDHSFDTFSIENLSAQYEGDIEQVPFKLGIRGPGNLRGRTTASTVTGGGKVKK